ncbi:hypothetical protein FOA43_000707 [Brettanomyces nanus]|uniref:PIH1 N-terminal domain-containing protein n=1 Tax=Eeniella nana TaxID=13502 RepID=A0A875RTE2_EENNA|nr:uncharacterized protein FOA43_000707 [Brettanomyces nanus]QPG73397.1 hypothetical protein FOA43_000707 [Brettanomyces nanus]
MLNALETKKFGAASSKVTSNVESIVPEPHFVIKTKIFSKYRGSPSGTKLFVNVCTHSIVPLPVNSDGTDTKYFDPQLIFPLIMDNKWEIPIITSPDLRNGTDKKGQHCLIVDCLINDKPMNWCLVNKDLRMILIQWCFDAVEFRIGNNFIIDRDVIILPKRSYMGDLEDLQVDVEGITKDSEDVQHLQDNFHSESPSDLLAARRLQQEEHEIGDLKTSASTATTTVSGPLIQEIQDMKIDTSSSKTLETAQISRAVRFTTDFKRLSSTDTEKGYSYLLRITSEQLNSASEYRLQYNKDKKVLLIGCGGGKCAYQIEFPLPQSIDGHFSTYYLNSSKSAYVFVL